MKKILLIGNSYRRQIVIYPISDDYKLKAEINPALSDLPLIASQELPGGAYLLKHFIESFNHTVEITNIDFVDYKNLQSEKIKVLFSVLREGKQKEEYQIEKTIGVDDIVIKNTEQTNIVTDSDIENIDIVVISGVNQEAKKTTGELSKLFSNPNPRRFIVLDLQQVKNPAEFFDLFLTKHAQQTIAIISADLLRENGVRINKGLSWDITLEETLGALNEDAFLQKIKAFHSLIIKFGNEGALYVYHTKDNTLNSRFYFIPESIEGTTLNDFSNSAHGINEAYLAAFSNKIVFPYTEVINQPTEEVISNAIVAGMKACISFAKTGFSYNAVDSTISYPVGTIFNEAALNLKVIDSTNYSKVPAAGSILNFLAFKDQALIATNAALYVKQGNAFLFNTVPFAQINILKTYVKNEIEDFRGVEKLIVQYISQTKTTTPISIAVFGAPGSGKSFGVKQIAKSLDKKPTILEFNLSQFQSYDDLVKAFHVIRDECLRGKIPFVFFDEFDSEFGGKAMGWLKYFLAPMQDGVFKEGESLHPTGKAIFVFAGGTCSTFEKFEEKATAKENDATKLPDFISRLKSFINIQGIDQRNDADTFYPLRRAIVLRSMLTEFSGLKKQDGSLNIDDNLLGALLEIKKFKHGARSLETIIKQSNLENAKSFTKSNLPAQKILALHLDTIEFEKCMEQNYLPQEAIEKLAEMIHNNWWEGEIKKGSNKPGMKPWGELQEEFKDSNRQQAIDMIRKLNAYGYSIVPLDTTKNELTTFTKDEIERMAEMEHERWMNEKISNGWTYGTPRTDELKIHDCLLPWDELDEVTKDNDRNPVRNIPGLLGKVGFGITKTQK